MKVADLVNLISSSMTASRRAAAYALAFTLCMLIAGCATETRTTTTNTARPLPPEPQPAPVTPANAHASRMVFAVGSKPDDTDGNGYPDRIDATVMLFAQRYPTPMFVDGTFEFTLHASGQTTNADAPSLAQWTVSGEAIEKTKARTTIGPQYRFTLSLLDAGTDRYPLALADLTCTFIPADGSTPVASDGVRSIQIGRAVAGR